MTSRPASKRSWTTTLPPSLPIDAVLPDLLASLRAEPNAVLVAPPGAGKTTRVPLALLDEPWLGGAKVILLEPRRLAARAAAEHMAATLGEAVGDTVGLRVRLGSKVGPRTRIEVVTEGVFTRMILDDPALDGVGAVLFDEFHERSLDADTGLAFARDAQTGLRENLRLLAMSATLDGARVATLLGEAPVIASEGRAYPVETTYLGHNPGRRIEDEVTDAVVRALRAEPGSVLVVLPGEREIRRVASLLAERVTDPAVDVAPLYGALDRAAQDRAVAPAPSGRRKVVLATSIAETSLTIEGVRVVVDSGLARVPLYEPDLGLTRLVTRRASRASVDQRRGRAGRTAPGVCYRLWEEAATAALEPFGRPEILSADLAPLLLDAAAWGVTDPSALPFLDAPPRPTLQQARLTLTELGALDADGRLTDLGRRLRALGLPPRLACMVVAAAERGQAIAAAELAAVLVERGLGGNAVDLADRVERFRRDRSPHAEASRGLARSWARRAEAGRSTAGGPKAAADTPAEDVGALVATAYPDRIARARGRLGEFVMAGGRGAVLDAHERLAGEAYLAVAEVQGAAAAARIVAAAALTPEALETVAGDRVVEAEELTFDPRARALRARATRRLGAVVLDQRPLRVPATHKAAQVLARGLASLGAATWPWSDAARQWRERVLFLRAAEGEGSGTWPDLGDAALEASAETWLAPHLIGLASADALSPATLRAALEEQLPWPLRARLEAEAPTHVTVPTGSRIAIDYGAEGGPALPVRVQELFGLDRHPAIVGGRVPLVLHLLSPAGRPIQVTRDLPSFWRGSWSAVRSEMRGRYPRHPWPDDPLAAVPTRRAKPRGS